MGRRKKILTAQDLMSESQIQKLCVSLLRRWCPNVMFNHSPNEGDRTVWQNVNLSNMGMCSGWPDLEILSNGKSYFIEFKSRTGRINPKQQYFADWCSQNGFNHAFCRSASAFEDILCNWGFIHKDQAGVVHINYGGGLQTAPTHQGLGIFETKRTGFPDSSTTKEVKNGRRKISKNESY